MSSPHRSRLTVHPISIAAFTLLASALLLGLPAQSSAQGQAAADIQLTADQTLSTTTTVEAQGGQAVVIEIFGTGFTDAVGLEVYVGVDDPTAISGTPTVLGNPTYFPPSPFAGVEVGDSSFKGNLSAAFLGAGFNKITVTDTAPQYLGEMTFVLADGFQAVTFTVTRVVFSGSVGGSDGVLPNVVLTATNPTAGPKTFGADLDPAPGNQGVLSRRANPNVRLPVQTFAGKLSGVTGIEIHAQVDLDAFDIERTGFAPSSLFSVVAPTSSGGGTGTGGGSGVSEVDNAAADIQLSGDQAASTGASVEAEPGQTVTIEIFGTGFTDAVGLEVYVGVDDPTAISGTPTVLGNPTYFPPSPFAGVEVGDSSFKGNLSAAFLGAGFNKITVTDATPQYLGEMTLTLADGFQAVTFTVTRVVFSGSVGGSDGVYPNIVLTANRASGSGGAATVEIQDNTVIARVSSETGVSGSAALGRFSFLTLPGFSKTQITFTKVVFTTTTAATKGLLQSDTASETLEPNLVLNILPSTSDAPQVVRPPVPSTVSDTRAIFEGSFNKLGTVRLSYGTAPTALLDTVKSDAPVESYRLLLDNLTAQTSYFFQVSSVDAQGRESDPFPPRPARLRTRKEDLYPPKTLRRPAVIDRTPTSATVVVSLDEAASVKVLHGTAEDALTETVASALTDAQFHAIPLTGLASGTHYFKIQATDLGDRMFESPKARKFILSSTADTKPLLILGRPSANVVFNTAVVGYKTNKFSDTGVFYSLSKDAVDAYLSGGTGTLPDSMVVDESERSHQVTLVNLLVDTTYYYAVRSVDAGGNTGASNTFKFKTRDVEDETAPRIVLPPIVPKVTNTEATIALKTNEPTLLVVQVHTTSDVHQDTTGTVGETLSNPDPARDHEMTLTNLTAATQYFYKVMVTDLAGNGPTTNEGELSFATRPEADDKAPFVFSKAIATDITASSANVSWGADEPHTAVIYYVAQPAGTDTSTVEQIDPERRHTAIVSGLESGTTYKFWVETSDGSGNSSVSAGDDMVFTTLTAADSDPPEIVRGPTVLNITESSATIEWFTDERSDSRALYGLTSDYTEVIEESTPARFHSIVLTDLTAGTTYHYAVGSADQSGNVVTTNAAGTVLGVSADHTFKTLKAGKQQPPVILEGPIVESTDQIVIVKWKTNRKATSKVTVGVDPGSAFADTANIPVFGQTSGEHAQLVAEEPGETRNHSVTVTGLVAGVPYFFQASSTRNGLPVSSYDPVAPKLAPPGGFGSFTTSTQSDTQFPVITSGPTVVASTSSSLTVEWQTDESSNSVVSFGASADSLSGAEQEGTNVTGHRMVLTKLTAGQTYAYKVASTDVSGNGATESQTAYGTTPSDVDLTAPVITVDPSAIYKTDNAATISWETNEVADAEVVYGTSAASLDEVFSVSDLETVHSLTLTNLTVSTTYYYEVYSKDQSNNGPVQSAVDSFTTDAQADQTVPVISNVAAAAADSSALITWTTDELSDSAVKYGPEGGTLDFVAGDATDVTSHSITLTNLSPSTTYAYQVESTDRSDNGPTQGAQGTFTTAASGAVTKPTAPTNLSPTAGNSMVKLTWDASASSGVVGYVVERAQGGGSYTPIASLDAVETYLDATAQNGESYTYQVSATGSGQLSGDPSDPSDAVTPSVDSGPDAPTLFVTQGNPLTPTIVITNSSGTDLTYTFHVSSASDYSDAISLTAGVQPGSGMGASDPSGKTAWTITRSLTDGQTYYWRVKASDGTFEGAFLSGLLRVDGTTPEYPGDYNGDFSVNFQDFARFAQHFNTKTGDAGYNADADFTNDGAINFQDFARFAQHFNNKYIAGVSSSKPVTIPVAYGSDPSVEFDLAGRPASSEKGAIFSANVVLANASDLRGFGVTVSYDPAQLEFLSASAGSDNLLKTDGRQADLFGTLQNDAAKGEVLVGGAISEGAPVDGGGTVAVLRFRLLEDSPQGDVIHIAQGLVIDGDFEVDIAHNLGGRLSLVPDSYALEHNYPNPFNPETVIRYAVPEPMKVTLRVYNVLGQEVITLVDKHLMAGFYTARWSGIDQIGRAVASGVYLYRLEAGDFKQTHKMLLLK